MEGTRYVVVRGDTLWEIAARTLGDPRQWPRIWRYNNRRQIVAVTGRGVPNPDLIYPGQVLLIPRLPNQVEPSSRASVGASVAAPLPAPAPTARSIPNRPLVPPAPTAREDANDLQTQLQKVRSPISLKYKLDDLKFPPIAGPGFKAELKLQGDLLMVSDQAYPAVYVTQRKELELQMAQRANAALGTLLGDNRIIFDAQSRIVTLRSMLISSSSTPGVSSSGIGVEIGADGVPKLRAELKLPSLRGQLQGFAYTAIEPKAVVELTPDSGQPPDRKVERVESSPSWNKLIGAGFVVGAGLIVTATIVEDFLTAGAGVGDDPASFMLAATSLARGLRMLGVGSLAIPHATAGQVNVKLRLQAVAPSSRGLHTSQ